MTDSKVSNLADIAHVDSEKDVPELSENGAVLMLKNRRSWVITQVDLEYE